MMERALAAVRAAGVLTGILTVLTTAALLGAGPAYGCSCMEPPADEVAIQAAPIAFVGRQVDRLESGGEARLLFEVEEVFKGDVGDLVELRTSASEEACGTDLAAFGLVGVIPEVSGNVLSVSRCSGAVDAAVMRYMLEPLPAPSGTVPPTFVAAPGGGAAPESTWRWIAAATFALAALSGVAVVARRPTQGVTARNRRARDLL